MLVIPCAGAIHTHSAALGSCLLCHADCNSYTQITALNVAEKRHQPESWDHVHARLHAEMKSTQLNNQTAITKTGSSSVTSSQPRVSNCLPENQHGATATPAQCLARRPCMHDLSTPTRQASHACMHQTCCCTANPPPPHGGKHGGG